MATRRLTGIEREKFNATMAASAEKNKSRTAKEWAAYRASKATSAKPAPVATPAPAAPPLAELTPEERTAFVMVNQGDAMQSCAVSDPAILARATALMTNSKWVGDKLNELVFERACRQAASDLRVEEESGAREREREQAALDRASRRAYFASADVSTLEDSLVFFLDQLGLLEPTFALLMPGDTRIELGSHGRDHRTILRTHHDKGGQIGVDLKGSRLGCILVDSDGVENFARLSAFFKMPQTLAWGLPDGRTLHLFSDGIESDEGSRLVRKLLPGVQYAASGLYPIPPQPGCEWRVKPAAVVLGESESTLPRLSPDMLDVFHALRRVDDSRTWQRYINAMIVNNTKD